MNATNVARFTSTHHRQAAAQGGVLGAGQRAVPHAGAARPGRAAGRIRAPRQRFVAALRAIEPDAVIGLPLTMDRRNGIPTTHVSGFTPQVLAG